METTDRQRIMDLAYDAGIVLLENGAKISRVEETMSGIATHISMTALKVAIAISFGITIFTELINKILKQP